MTAETSTWATKKGLAQMLKGGVIMDVVTPEHAKIAEDAGAVRRHGARARPGRHPRRGRRRPHERSGHDRGDHGRGQHPGHGQGPDRPLRRGPGPRGARRRLHRRVGGPDAGRRGEPHRQARLQGAVRVRLPQPRRGAAPHQRGRGDDPDQGRGRHRQHRRGRPPHPDGDGRDPPPRVDARGRAVRRRQGAARRRTTWSSRSRAEGRLPVVNFVAGGIAIPADAALAMQLGAEGVFVGSGIFKSENPARTAEAIVQATLHFDNPKIIAEVSKGLGARCAASRRSRSPRPSVWRSGAGSPA